MHNVLSMFSEMLVCVYSILSDSVNLSQAFYFFASSKLFCEEIAIWIKAEQFSDIEPMVF